VKIVTWNINSVRARLNRLLDWLRKHEPDVVCLQETKVTDADFPRLEIEAYGYKAAFYGEKSYNGVAILARGEPEDVVYGFPGDGGEKRVLSATVGGVRIMTVYVPNGNSLNSERFAFKLDWFDAFGKALDAAGKPGDPLVIGGDFNVAPEDRDVHDPERWRGKLLCTEPEREKFRALLDWGLADALRLHNPDPGFFTWWDYRMGGFRRDWGLRIDHFLVTRPVAERTREVTVDREERAGEKPSDHAPVVLRLD
jgi:exodeoxyribonuclease-3